MKTNKPSSKIQQLLQAKRSLQSSSSARRKPNLHWKPAKLLRRVTTNPALQQWLTLESSLTQKLKQTYPQLEVVILSETFESPLSSESQCLGLAIEEQAWIRCVVLQSAGKNLIYARTVIPAMHPQNPWYELQNLGNKPLGEVLFEDKSIQRTPFQFSKDKLSHWPNLGNLANHEHATDFKPPNADAYARRSVFLKNQVPLLLTEVFLPELQNQTDLGTSD